MMQSRANKTAIYQWQDGRQLQRRAPQMQSDLGWQRLGWWLCCSGTWDETSRTTCRRAAGQQVQQGSSRHLSVDEGPPSGICMPGKRPADAACVCTLCISRQGFQGPGWASVGALPGEGGTGYTPLAGAGWR